MTTIALKFKHTATLCLVNPSPILIFCSFVLYFESISVLFTSPLDQVLLKAEPHGFLAYAYLRCTDYLSDTGVLPRNSLFHTLQRSDGHKEFSHEYADVTRSMLKVLADIIAHIH